MLIKETCCYTDIGKYRISAEVTSRCIFKCFYCYRNIIGADLDFNLLKDKIEFLKEFPDDFLITGGEPLFTPKNKRNNRTPLFLRIYYCNFYFRI